MAKVIPFPRKTSSSGNLIVQTPFCFRWADWGLIDPVCMDRRLSDQFENLRKPTEPVETIPSHIVIQGAVSRTVEGLYRYRNDESKMRDVYFLAGLMELVIGVTHHVLRTDLIHRVFGVIREMSSDLNHHWQSDQGQWSRSSVFLLPLPSDKYPKGALAQSLSQTDTLKDLLESLRVEVNCQFDMSAVDYTYYLPPHWSKLKS